MSLSAADFPAYFGAIHGHDPLPWQQRLATEVLTTGWPSVLSLPTASGKTAILDIAVFVLAAQSQLPAAQRTACRRIALVVDRRIVVDDATRRAEKIRDAIIDATTGILHQVGSRLRELAGAHAEPLQVATLRGGMYREDRWARSPRQPVILCSTVDQVGSRLLHRGYGISPRMAPIHAGLLANDCCIILDEAHISEPFRQTLAYIAQYRNVGTCVPSTPFHVVSMTATPRNDDRPFALDAADRAHPVLAVRLAARKEARLIIADKKDKDLVQAGVTAIREVLDWHTVNDGMGRLPVRSVLVVLNRVASARAVYDALTPQKKPPLDAEVILLTGRTRSLQRDRLLANYRERIMAGRDPRADVEHKPLIVVATQCVEVGADLDLDALVSEACSLDALRQRLGRLDRLGSRGRSPVQVIIRAEAVGSLDQPADDPIYGTALSHTWHWLHTLPKTVDESCDLGIAGLEPHIPAPLACSAPALDAPIMFPVYCDLWVQTGPQPACSPDPAIFLHGPQRQAADVRVVWRADLGDNDENWAAIIACCPPMTSEGMPLPLHLARAWLGGVEIKRLADQGGDVPESAPDQEPELTAVHKALRWRGPDDSEPIEADHIRPGDVLIVPCSYGGCDAQGWNPNTPYTDDLADAALLLAHRSPVLRLSPVMLRQSEYAALPMNVLELAQWDNSDDGPGWPEDWRERLRTALGRATDGPSDVATIITALAREPRPHCEPHPDGTGVVISGSRRLGLAFTDQDHTSSIADIPCELIPHLDDVRSWAAHHGQDLPPELVSDLALAGHLHDLGKADPRFQAWLAGGDPIVAAMQHTILAKSNRLSPGRSSAEAARVRSGYPQGGRHELLSVRLAESCAALKERAHDWDLVLHLVASHHGHCRPFAPVVVDERPLTVQIDFAGHPLTASSVTGLEHLGSGIAERFWTLIRRYGWWGLSYLEACLRLGDHRASESPGEEHRP